MAADKKHSNPAEEVASSDIITEILIRLPLKKLIQYKLASKLWCSFITSPGFDRSRDLHQIPTSVRNFVSCTDLKSIRYIDFFPIQAEKPIIGISIVRTHQRKTLTLSDDSHGTRILHSCHGLLFCSNFRLNENAWKYYVCNMSTNEFSVIAEPGRVNEDMFEVLGVSLAFDPSKSPHYRAVCVVKVNCISGTQNVFQIYIYCSKTSLWTKSGEPFSKYIDYNNGVYWSGFYWKGAVYWVDRVGYSKFVCYNIEEHTFKDIPMTPELFYSMTSCYFGESRGGRLNAFLIEDKKNYVYIFDIYQLREDGSAWYIKHRVYLYDILDAYAKIWPDTSNFLRVLTVAHGETDSDTFLVLGTPGKAVWCNIYSPIIEKLHDF